MKFIRDIINEKKLSGEIDGPSLQDPSSDTANQPFEEEPGELGPLELGAFGVSFGENGDQSDTPDVTIAKEAEADVPGLVDSDPLNEDESEHLSGFSDPIGNLFSDAPQDHSEASEPESEAVKAELLAEVEPVEADESPFFTEPEETNSSEAFSLQETLLPPAEPAANLSGKKQVDLAVAELVTGEQIPEPVVIPVEVPKPATGRAASRSGRVKTRLLGFSTPDSTTPDPFAKPGEVASAGVTNFPVGWLVITDGPGRGAAFTLFDGLTQIGRGEDQTVRLNFGDNSISRENHAAIAFDAEQGRFYFGHGGKANLVRLNGRPVLSTEDLPSESQIRIGETTLHFVALCGEKFTWGTDQQKVAVNDATG